MRKAAAVLSLALSACPSTPQQPPPPGPPVALPAPPVTPPPPPPGVPPPSTPPTGGGAITIAPGGGGGISVQGAPALHGDPAACAAYQACCAPHQGQLSPAGLACGITPAASNGDCTQSLQAIRGIFSEQGIALAPGCSP